MGKIVAILVALLGAWGSLAQIMPDVFQLRRDGRLAQFLWGPKSIWVAVMLAGFLLGWYIWSLEDRLSTAFSGTSAIATSDSTGLRFALWWPSPDGSGCGAAIDASKLATRFRDAFEIALICGFVDPAADKFKDSRITVSPLFTPQTSLSITVPFSKTMIEILESDREATVKKIHPPLPKGTVISLQNMIWLRLVLLPKGFDASRIHTLADVTSHGGELAGEAGVGIGRNVTIK